MTFDTLGQLDKRAPEITQAVDDGKKVWHKYDCIGCHTIFGNGTYFAPDMTKMAARKPKSYLKQFIMDPKSVNAQAVMPKFGITSDEADNLIAFLDWVSKVDTNNWPPPILAAAGVAGKHLPQDSWGSRKGVSFRDLRHRRNVAGPLRGRAARPDWLFGHFKDPQKYVKNSAMPPVTLPDEELRQLTDYMLTLKKEVKK
jgi:nitric oxide reductase subunit C